MSILKLGVEQVNKIAEKWQKGGTISNAQKSVIAGEIFTSLDYRQEHKVVDK